MSVLVTIIVPTFRRNESLRKTLQSLFEQDQSDCEIIVVDQQPSHDKSTEEFLLANRNRIKYVAKDHANLPAARNTGIEVSKGEIIVFSDDDMVLPASTISSLLDSYKDPEVFGITGFVISEGEGGEVLNVTHGNHYRRRDSFGGLVKVNSFRGSFMSFRRETFEIVGLFDEWIGEQPTAAGEESELCFRMQNAGLALYLKPTLILKHQDLLPGGCGKSELSEKENTSNSLRMAFYAYVKNRPNDGIHGYAAAIFRCYRAWVLNRSLLNLNPLFHWRRHRTYFQALRFALDASRQAPSRDSVRSTG